jgi:outer membrane protein assembly factor BamD (BamD/ComL family)
MTASSSSSLASEVGLVRDAHLARENGDADAALTYLAMHRRDFPHGTLVEEREVETVLALCALGRVDEARTNASAFEATFPSSAHADRVARSCARSRHEPASDRALTP